MIFTLSKYRCTYLGENIYRTAWVTTGEGEPGALPLALRNEVFDYDYYWIGVVGSRMKK